MQDYITLIQNFFDTFAFYEIGLMGALFIIFVLFFMLGLLLRGRRFFSKFFFFLSFMLFVSAPFLLQFCMQHFLYKTDIHILQNKRLEYINAFFLQAKVTNTGFAPFITCEVSVDILHDGFLKPLSRVYPKKHYKQTIPLQLQPNQSDEFQLIFDDFTPTPPFDYTLYIDCHNSNGLNKLLHKTHDTQPNTHTPNAPTQP